MEKSAPKSTLETQALFFKASFAFQFFLLDLAKMSGAISIGFFPSNQGVCQMGFYGHFRG
jgi:hypothetical protein